MFNVMCDYKVIPHHSLDDKLDNILNLYSGKYCTLGKP